MHTLPFERTSSRPQRTSCFICQADPEDIKTHLSNYAFLPLTRTLTMATRLLLILAIPLVFARSTLAAIAQSFQPPSSSPESSSANYTGQSNNTLSNGPVVPGQVFDRFIQIWIENTDCECKCLELLATSTQA